MKLRRPAAPRPPARSGVAAVELGWVFMVFVFPLLLGIWQVGRMVQVQQIVSNAAREGARLAAQGTTIRGDGTVVQINRTTGTPNVRDVVYQYLLASGLTGLALADVDVTFAFTSGTGTEPYEGIKNQPFTVTVAVKWAKVRWVSFGFNEPDKLSFTVSWRMLVDEPFTVNSTLPTF